MKKLVKESLNESLNEKFDDCSVDVLDYEKCIKILQDEHPEYKLDYSPHPTKRYRYRVALYKGDNYIGAIKGPVSIQEAYEFYKRQLEK